MKKIDLYIFAISISILCSLNSCKKDQGDQTDKGNLQFSFNQNQLKSSDLSTKNPATLLVTVDDLNGQVLYDNYPLVLYNLNGNYVSDQISLIAGNYRLRSFMVVDKNNNVLYVTPMIGSLKAGLVNTSLPIPMIVSTNTMSKVAPEVLSIENGKSQEFGYSTYNCTNIKSFSFHLNVFQFIQNSQKLELTTADLSITGDSGWVLKKSLSASLNTITVKDNQSKYILTVKKDGFNTWLDTLSASQLKLYFKKDDKGPLKVILSKIKIFPSIVKDIDGNIYHTIVIGTQCWLKENLKVTHLNDGTPIPNVTDNAIWMHLSHMGYCWYNNNVVNKNIYGALYNEFAVQTARLAPHGWHVATTQDMFTLTNYFGNTIGSASLMETGNVHWFSSSTATNSSGFTALPGGFRTDDTQNGIFVGLNYDTQWWCSDVYQTPSGSLKMNAWEIQSYDAIFPQLGLDFFPNNVNGCSVRCLKD